MAGFDEYFNRGKFNTSVCFIAGALFLVCSITGWIDREPLQNMAIFFLLIFLPAVIFDRFQELSHLMAQRIETDYIISDFIKVRDLHIRHKEDQYTAGRLRISMDADLSIEDSQGFPVAEIRGEELVMLIKYFQQIDMDEVFARNAKINAEE